MRIAIIGGGIAGLAAAYELQQARAAGSSVEYTLFEANDRLGGCIRSETIDGAVLERGPDSFLTEKPAAAELCRELGLGDDLIASNDAARKTWIVVGNRLVSLPDGLMFLIPTKLIPTALTRLFSLRTKIRMGLELLLPPRPSDEDESVATFVERHYGREVVDRLADPLLSGIYGGDSTELSVRTVLPRLVEMESQYGSLTRGMLAAHRAMLTRAKTAPRKNHSSGPRGVFTTLRGGMQQLVDALAARLDPASLRLSTPVRGVARIGSEWRLDVGGSQEHFGGVILATPAWTAAELMREVDAQLATDLGGIPYSSSITINLIYDETQLGRLPDGFGFLVPATEGRSLLASTFVHRKFLGRTPTGKAVLRAFLGGMKNASLLTTTDDTLTATVRRELTEILGSAALPLDATPEYVQVSRWPRAMAQYAVGHLARKERISERVATLPGLRLAGNAYDGIGISDCARLGRQAAKELIAAQ
jgi:oxygen-dependent protoporphyrinogen oxidase